MEDPFPIQPNLNDELSNLHTRILGPMVEESPKENIHFYEIKSKLELSISKVTGQGGAVKETTLQP